MNAIIGITTLMKNELHQPEKLAEDVYKRQIVIRLFKAGDGTGVVLCVGKFPDTVQLQRQRRGACPIFFAGSVSTETCMSSQHVFLEKGGDVYKRQVWSREDKLSLRDRSLVTVIALMAQGLTDSSFRYHLTAAKNNGDVYKRQDKDLPATLCGMVDVPVVPAARLKGDVVNANLCGGQGCQIAFSA